MLQVALKLGTLTETDTVALASTILTSLPNAAGVTPDPTLAALKTLRDAAQDGLDAVLAAMQALATAVVNKDNAMEALRTAISTEADTVQTAVASLPDAQAEATIMAAGMRVRSAATRVSSLDPVTGLSMTAGDTPGEMDWHCEPVARARFYGTEYTTDPVSPTAKWQPGRSTTASSGTFVGLTSGSSVSIRVHAEGARGLTGAPETAGPKIVP